MRAEQPAQAGVSSSRAARSVGESAASCDLRECARYSASAGRVGRPGDSAARGRSRPRRARLRRGQSPARRRWATAAARVSRRVQRASLTAECLRHARVLRDRPTTDSESSASSPVAADPDRTDSVPSRWNSSWYSASLSRSSFTPSRDPSARRSRRCSTSSCRRRSRRRSDGDSARPPRT